MQSSQQRTLTPSDAWSCPTLGLASALILRPISPELVLFPNFFVSSIPWYFCFAWYPLWFVKYWVVHSHCINVSVIHTYVVFLRISVYLITEHTFSLYVGTYNIAQKQKHWLIFFVQSVAMSYYINLTKTVFQLISALDQINKSINGNKISITVKFA